ncbi:MAG: hypothetical protein EOP45_19850 [Sphingobacteriaceae bacterium]|nr:MAG: hypothetical protein EOP45_19850 [Sphingobacteriaceae bacterium]
MIHTTLQAFMRANSLDTQVISEGIFDIFKSKQKGALQDAVSDDPAVEIQKQLDTLCGANQKVHHCEVRVSGQYGNEYLIRLFLNESDNFGDGASSLYILRVSDGRFQVQGMGSTSTQAKQDVLNFTYDGSNLTEALSEIVRSI